MKAVDDSWSNVIISVFEPYHCPVSTVYYKHNNNKKKKAPPCHKRQVFCILWHCFFPVTIANICFVSLYFPFFSLSSRSLIFCLFILHWIVCRFQKIMLFYLDNLIMYNKKTATCCLFLPFLFVFGVICI